MYEIYLKLLNEKGCKTSDVCKATGIVASTFSDWKKGKSSPKTDKLQKIADYFCVSLEYLMTGEEDEQTYYLDPDTAKTAQEIFENDKILFDAYKGTSKERLIEYAKKLMELEELENGGEGWD